MVRSAVLVWALSAPATIDGPAVATYRLSSNRDITRCLRSSSLLYTPISCLEFQVFSTSGSVADFLLFDPRSVASHGCHESVCAALGSTAASLVKYFAHRSASALTSPVDSNPSVRSALRSIQLGLCAEPMRKIAAVEYHLGSATASGTAPGVRACDMTIAVTVIGDTRGDNSKKGKFPQELLFLQN